MVVLTPEVKHYDLVEGVKINVCQIFHSFILSSNVLTIVRVSPGWVNGEGPVLRILWQINEVLPSHTACQGGWGTLLSFYPFLRKANFLDKVGGISRPSPVKSLQLVDT
ncbi:hypothetical protein LF01B1_12670 [Limosilactobacillus fermentum]|uniref:Uncharacterized protein n=1 Tax=Limosilactobacillus fermentum TaxID=1613 RepID=A0ABD0ALE7_LIMFE|nr:hypothetical protein LF01B1_12670 [Limosilactobacillus fermentum]